METSETIAFLTRKWAEEFADEKAAWDMSPGWPAKLVVTTFELGGSKHSIKPTDIGLTDDCWDQGFMESVQGRIARDLEAHGAVNVRNLGFLD